MAEIHEGGCLCGAVRYRKIADPAIVIVCHCTSCQRRTGSAFGIGAYFREEHVQILQGSLKTYELKSDESGRWLRMEFCERCGSTVTWRVELRPGHRAIAAGTFDEPGWYKVDRHIWTRSAHPWVIDRPDVAMFDTIPPP